MHAFILCIFLLYICFIKPNLLCKSERIFILLSLFFKIENKTQFFTKSSFYKNDFTKNRKQATIKKRRDVL